VKELLKSVQICQSYRKNKTGTFFYGPRCMFSCRRSSRQSHDSTVLCTTCVTRKTRSSATAEKQRVTCPHGGRGLGPPAHSPFAPSGYAYGRIRKPQRTYVKRAVHKAHFKMNRALWLWSYLAPFSRYGDLLAKNCLFFLHFCYPSPIRRPRSLCSPWNFALKLTVRKLESWGYPPVKTAWS